MAPAKEVWCSCLSTTRLTGASKTASVKLHSQSQLLWSGVLIVSAGLSVYLGQQIFVDYINGSKGSKIDIIDSTEREKLEDILRLAYCPTDFVDPEKAKNVPWTVLQYGLSLIPDLEYMVMEHIYLSLNKEWDDILLTKVGSRKTKWNETLTPQALRNMANELQSYVTDQGISTLDDFLVSISYDMVEPSNVTYRRTEVVRRYPRYGTFCYEVASHYDKDEYLRYGRATLVSGPNLFTFDFRHFTRNVTQHRGDPVRGDRVQQLEPGVIDMFSASLSELDSQWTNPTIYLSLNTGAHGISDEYVGLLDETTGMRPYQSALGQAQPPGYMVSEEILDNRAYAISEDDLRRRRRREYDNYDYYDYYSDDSSQTGYFLAGEMRFRVTAVKATKIDDCSNSHLDLRTNGVIAIKSCIEQKRQCKQRMFTLSGSCVDRCSKIGSLTRDFAADGTPPCNWKMWSSVWWNATLGDCTKISNTDEFCNQPTDINCQMIKDCVGYTLEARPEAVMTPSRGELAYSNWHFVPMAKQGRIVSDDEAEAHDVPLLYTDRYVLRVSIEMTSVSTIVEYHLVKFETMVGGVGGIFGLCLGVSIISLVEAVVRTMSFVCCKRGRVSV